MADRNPGDRAIGIRIAAVGHRDAGDEARAAAVRSVLASILGVCPGSSREQVAAPGVILSSLAEGADRLVARVGLEFPGVDLHALLPLAPEDYRRDFASAASRAEFDALLARASSVEVLPPADTREAAYVNAGRVLVDRCDAVVAIWDGGPARGPGGTADVVAYAREKGRPLHWILSGDPSRIVVERLETGSG